MSNSAFYIANPSNLVPQSLPLNFRQNIKKVTKLKKKAKSKGGTRLVGAGIAKDALNIPLRSFDSIVPKKLSAKAVLKKNRKKGKTIKKKSKKSKHINKKKKSRRTTKKKTRKGKSSKSTKKIKQRRSKSLNNGLLL